MTTEQALRAVRISKAYSAKYSKPRALPPLPDELTPEYVTEVISEFSLVQNIQESLAFVTQKLVTPDDGTEDVELDRVLDSLAKLADI